MLVGQRSHAASLRSTVQRHHWADGSAGLTAPVVLASDHEDVTDRRETGLHVFAARACAQAEALQAHRELPDERRDDLKRLGHRRQGTATARRPLLADSHLTRALPRVSHPEWTSIPRPWSLASERLLTADLVAHSREQSEQIRLFAEPSQSGGLAISRIMSGCWRFGGSPRRRLLFDVADLGSGGYAMLMHQNVAVCRDRIEGDEWARASRTSQRVRAEEFATRFE